MGESVLPWAKSKKLSKNEAANIDASSANPLLTLEKEGD
jgi:hypothetical protein